MTSQEDSREPKNALQVLRRSKNNLKYLTELHKTLRPHKNKQDCARLYSIPEGQTRLNEGSQDINKTLKDLTELPVTYKTSQENSQQTIRASFLQGICCRCRRHVLFLLLFYMGSQKSLIMSRLRIYDLWENMCSAFETFRVKGNINQNCKSYIDRFCSVFSTAPLFSARMKIGKRAKGRNKERKKQNW